MEMTPNYSDNNVGFDKGREYEVWVQEKYPQVYLQRKLTYFEGKTNQLKGETEEGIEVKFDDLIEKYGRTYIETKEKTHIENKNYVDSGIYRTDNSRLYLIGDYTQWFLFSKAKLIWLDRLDPPFLYRPKPTSTSIGFCIPIKNAKELALDYQQFERLFWQEEQDSYIKSEDNY
jgi:hypothetical protein